MLDIEEFAMEQEHKELNELAEQIWVLKRRLAYLENMARKRSHYFMIGDDGLVDLIVGSVI